MKMTKQQFDNTAKYLRVKPTIIDMRIHFDGCAALRKALDEQPELEAELILREAARNPDLLDMIQERACIRWENGYSDSLYMAVLCNINPTGEIAELDEKGHPRLRQKTDWDKELKRYNK